MLRLSRLTDYGILLLTRFARDAPGRVHTARDLAQECGLPLPTVSKLLKILTRAGLLVSHRGVQGGYALARAPEAVTMAEIVTACEGPVALTLCAEGPGACTLEDGCVTRPGLTAVNAAIRAALEGLRLSELARSGPAPVRVSAPTARRVSR